ncbi:MAG TPA: cytochrome P450 [Acidimicrobiales bacterium]|jgi:cytochrome P450|nr:cytochrome P450 [Acidimicrobiales bacterium]
MTITAPFELDDDVDYAVEYLPDLHERMHRLRASKPAAWVRSFGRPTLIFTSYELVDAAFRDEETFPSAAFYGQVVTDVLGRNMQCMYGAEHKRNRALASPAFRQRLMPGLIAPLLEPVAHELIDRFEADGHTDLVADFTRRYPFKIILGLLGLPHAAEDDVARWALGMLDIQQHHDTALACSREFMAFVDPFLQRRRDEPGTDLISTLAVEEIDGERLTDDEIFNFLRLLFPAGADTTYLGLGSTLLGLLQNPDQLELVRADPAVECAWAAAEGVRWNPPVPLLPRHNPTEVVWRGIPIPADTPLIFAIGAANRDPAVFDDPDRFDVTRRPLSTLTFGLGMHYCLGVHLARAEMDVALRVLLERLPRLRVVDDGDIRVMGSFVQLLQGPNRLPVRFD